MRLIAGGKVAGREALRAGIEIKLASGWKTYWRYPGDSGIPPQFDFAASDNVASVEVLWPAPERFADGIGHSIGYRDQVILPLRIIRSDTARPATLRLDLRYAVCEKLCVPVHGKAELRLTGSAGAQNALVRAEARVPQPAKVGATDALAVRSVRRDDSGKPPRIIVEVSAPDGAAIDLFAEGPTPAWALPLPQPRSGATSTARAFSFALDGLPTNAKARGAELTLTLVGPSRAVEVKTRLD